MVASSPTSNARFGTTVTPAYGWFTGPEEPAYHRRSHVIADVSTPIPSPVGRRSALTRARSRQTRQLPNPRSCSPSLSADGEGVRG